MELDKASLRPALEHEGEPDHWLRHGDRLIPAGYSKYGEHGRWALTDGCIYTGEGAWAMGLRYEKPCRPDAIVPDADNPVMVELVMDALRSEKAETGDPAIIRTVIRMYARRVLTTLAALAKGDGK